jgi:hypothetical protein
MELPYSAWTRDQDERDIGGKERTASESGGEEEGASCVVATNVKTGAVAKHSQRQRKERPTGMLVVSFCKGWKKRTWNPCLGFASVFGKVLYTRWNFSPLL